MFIYNVTTNVSLIIFDAWMNWLREEHIPAMLTTNCFSNYQLLKLHEQNDDESVTFITQYFIENKELYNRFTELYADEIEKAAVFKWRNKSLSFKTLLEKIE